jgi:hypothetical protein
VSDIELRQPRVQVSTDDCVLARTVAHYSSLTVMVPLIHVRESVSGTVAEKFQPLLFLTNFSTPIILSPELLPFTMVWGNIARLDLS